MPAESFAQTLIPLGALGLTILVALVPLIAILVLLSIFRITAWLSSLIAGIITLVLAVLVWGAPLRGALAAYALGSLQGMWSVDWIILWGVVIFNTLVVTGNFERFKAWILDQATPDIRIQVILLAWSFGALLEGLVGFGFPWSVVVPILISIGIVDLEAIRVAALANNAPVSYGALGAPIIALAGVTGLPLLELSRSVGFIVAALALLPPWVLLYLVSGRQGLKEAWPLAIVASFSYIAGQLPVAAFLGPYLPDLTGAMVSFWVIFLFIKVWRPKVLRGFGGKVLEKAAISTAGPRSSARDGWMAWLPYIVLIVVVVAWTGPWSALTSIRLWHQQVVAQSSVTAGNVAAAFNFTPLSGGTAILASWLILLAILRPSRAHIGQVFIRTFRQIWGALIVSFLMFGLAFVFNYSGMASSLAYGFSRVGVWFIVLAPVLGWVGVALSGSNTSTNTMFGAIQALTGRLLGMPPLLLPSLNSVGSEVGKPIAPQTASVGVSTSSFVRNEGEVIRHNMGWTLIFLAFLILIGLLYYFIFPGVMEPR